MSVETKFFGEGYARYRVELDTWRENDEPRSDCIIYHDTSVRRTGCQASLACLQDTGYLENHSNSSMHKVEQGMIDDIAKWAEENGY